MTQGAALVTGAGARIGRAMAEALGQAGWHVGVHYNRSAEGAEAAVSAVRKHGVKAETLCADLSDPDDYAGLLNEASESLGAPITLLVNSASVFVDDRIETYTDETWRKHMDTNLRAPVDLIQQFSAALPADRDGLAVNLIDQRVLKLNPQFFTYTLSKTALWTATRTLAQALAPRIRVNAIGPGPVLKSIHQTTEDFENEARATLLQRAASPDDLIRALFYLIDARSVTGQMIVCDSGQHLLWQTPDLVP
jgi:NAD(P)-dependent dehydrogenase (short-subunit alcohol dehydrogenase family)